MEKWKEINELSQELMRISMPDGEFVSWTMYSPSITKNGDFVMIGDLQTKEYSMGNRVFVTYHGVTFTLNVRGDIPFWGFFIKCASEEYRVVDDNNRLVRKGTNWSGCILPRLSTDIQTRESYLEKVELAILHSI